MKWVIGQNGSELKDYTHDRMARGSYVSFACKLVYVESYEGVKRPERCDLHLVSENYTFTVRDKADEHITLERANAFIRDFWKKDEIDLEEYDLKFYDQRDRIPRSMSVSNDVDYEGNDMELLVRIAY